MKSSQCENLYNLFSRKISYLTGSHCQFICELSGQKQDKKNTQTNKEKTNKTSKTKTKQK
jgi:hypothetical protein